MRRPSSPRHVLSRVPPKMAALLVAAGLALAMVPAVPAWAASNEAHLDRQVLKAMQAGQSIPGIVGCRRDLNVLPAGLPRSGLKHNHRRPACHRRAVQLKARLIQPLLM